jgi:hypothetical protein
MTNKEMVLAILELQKTVADLTAKVDAPKASVVEMTNDHARAVLNGEHAAKKHKDAATALGLTYGQVYSCRLEFTFKDVHKELKAAGFKNPWIKA